MPPKKHAIKGEPDFHNISDEKLKDFIDLTQQMLFAYKYHDEAKCKVLEEIWKELSCEDTDRSTRSVLEELDRQECAEKVHTESSLLLRKAPKMRKSPAKRTVLIN